MKFQNLRNFLSGTLQGNWILSVAAVNAVMMLLFIFDLTVRQHTMLTESQAEEAAAVSQSLATSAAGWIAADDISGLQELVEAVQKYPDIIFAMLTSSDGRVLAHTDKSRVGYYLSDLPKDARQTVLNKSAILTDAAAPAIVFNKHVGWARIGIGQKIRAKKFSEMRRSGVLYALVGIIIASLVAWRMGSRITQRLNDIRKGLITTAEQVAMAAKQVASAGQGLAAGTSEQASAIEKSSASIEEMTSMTRYHAENSDQANASVSETTRVIADAQISMSELTVSMGEIKNASQQTHKIVKTIDEIAFQTNMLALNAAIEAARAGETGAGFAVVADEVRSLAARTAEAAKNTAELIEGTVKQINVGTEIVLKTKDTFEEIASEAKKAGELVSGITATSNNLAHDIDQINHAVANVNKVTQQNAASAEECAAAAKEMSDQTDLMKAFAEELSALVGE